MALPVSYSLAPLTFKSCTFFKFPTVPISASFSIPNFNSSFSFSILCRATNSQTDPINKKKRSSSSSKKKKKKSSVGADDSNPLNFNDFEILHDFSSGVDAENASTSSDSSLYYPPDPMPLPEPPAGFVLGDNGKVLLASTNRLATIVDPTNNLPLECVIRRVFRSSDRDECVLLCPVDTPIQILKSTKVDGWSAISDEEVESILPAAAYALAKIHMHLVYSGYCYTARGGFCYTEEDLFDFHTDDGEGVDGLPTEGVEITCFNLEGARYMIYTPSDPLLFVAVKDENGMLQIADDDLIEDPAVIDAIDEETEFNALVEEEAALNEAMMSSLEEDEASPYDIMMDER
ncbi:uncharacterized protein LOC133292463 [Gastrolobium bilobum]|uniref:uncharacterized protein LOC133292463 n=1 Tax=Gastrolobium bilobum TaxID=150636 RepID=UPI002AAF81FF|nr:uncharacterized protein LOC133292463 [Gastrolobium bilobum]